MSVERTLVFMLASVVATVFAVRAGAQTPSDTLIHRLPEIRVEVARLAVGGVPAARVPYGVQIVGDPGDDARQQLTLADALVGLPGIHPADELGSPTQPGLMLRGFAVSPVVGMPQGVSVFVDGVRVNEPGASQVDFDLIPMQAVERIEVVRGPSGPYGKNTLGGAVNVVTRRGGADTDAGFEVAGGSFGTRAGRGYVSGSRGGVDFLAAARYVRRDGWRDQSAVRMGNLFAKVGRRGESSDAWLAYTFADDRILQAGSLPASWLRDAGSIPPEFDPGSDVDPRTINFTGGDVFEPRLHFAVGHWSRDIDERTKLKANVFARRSDIEQFNANFTESDTRILTDTRSGGGVAQLVRDQERFDLIGGVEYAVNDVGIEIFEHANQNYPDIPADGRITEDVGTLERNAGMFTQARFDPTPQLGLTGALRYDWVSLPFRDRREPENSGDNLFRQLTGSAGVDVVVGDHAVVFAAYGRGFRAPVILELACADPEAPCPLPYELGADPPLDPVKTDTWQAGLRTFHGARFTTEVTAYWSEVYDDIFTVQPLDTRAGYFDNIARTRRQGLELAVEASPIRGLNVHANLAYTRATFQTTARLATSVEREEEDDDPDLELEQPVVRPGHHFPLVPALQGALATRFSHGSWRGMLETRYVGSRWLRGDENNTEADLKLDSYLVVDARLERDVGPATLFFAAENVLDAAFESFGVLALNVLGGEDAARVEPFVTPGPPRQVRGGVRYRLP